MSKRSNQKSFDNLVSKLEASSKNVLCGRTIINDASKLIEILKISTKSDIFSQLSYNETDKLFKYLVHDAEINCTELAFFLETVDGMDKTIDEKIKFENLKNFIEKINKPYDVNEF